MVQIRIEKRAFRFIAMTEKIDGHMLPLEARVYSMVCYTAFHASQYAV
jgi:hypothetical protein